MKINLCAIKEERILNITIDNKEKLLDNLITPSKKIAPLLLCLLAYSIKEQQCLLPDKLQKEHILPKKWKDIYTVPKDMTVTDVNNYVEHIGNYLPLENRLNAKASNDWLKIKKDKYKDSQISLVLEFAKKVGDTWDVKKIIERDSEILSIIKNVLLTDI